MQEEKIGLGVIILVIVLVFNIIDFIIRERRELLKSNKKRQKKDCIESYEKVGKLLDEHIAQTKVLESRVDAFQVHLDYCFNVSNKGMSEPTPVDELDSFTKSKPTLATKPSESFESPLIEKYFVMESADLEAKVSKSQVIREVEKRVNMSKHKLIKMFGHEEYKRQYKNAYQRLYYRLRKEELNKSN
jgi:hypothetical protein